MKNVANILDSEDNTFKLILIVLLNRSPSADDKKRSPSSETTFTTKNLKDLNSLFSDLGQPNEFFNIFNNCTKDNIEEQFLALKESISKDQQVDFFVTMLVIVQVFQFVLKDFKLHDTYQSYCKENLTQHFYNKEYGKRFIELDTNFAQPMQNLMRIVMLFQTLNANYPKEKKTENNKAYEAFSDLLKRFTDLMQIFARANNNLGNILNDIKIAKKTVKKAFQSTMNTSVSNKSLEEKTIDEQIGQIETLIGNFGKNDDFVNIINKLEKQLEDYVLLADAKKIIWQEKLKRLQKIKKQLSGENDKEQNPSSSEEDFLGDVSDEEKDEGNGGSSSTTHSNPSTSPQDLDSEEKSSQLEPEGDHVDLSSKHENNNSLSSTADVSLSTQLPPPPKKRFFDFIIEHRWKFFLIAAASGGVAGLFGMAALIFLTGGAALPFVAGLGGAALAGLYLAYVLGGGAAGVLAVLTLSTVLEAIGQILSGMGPITYKNEKPLSVESDSEFKIDFDSPQKSTISLSFLNILKGLICCGGNDFDSNESPKNDKKVEQKKRQGDDSDSEELFKNNSEVKQEIQSDNGSVPRTPPNGEIIFNGEPVTPIKSRTKQK